MRKIRMLRKKFIEFNQAKTLLSLLFVFIGVLLLITACKKENEDPDPDAELVDEIHKFDPDAENVTIQWMGRTISCQKIGDNLIFQGDIVVIPDQDNTKAAELAGVTLWDEGKLYYYIDDSKFKYRKEVTAAMEHISHYTNIKFIELKTPEARDFRKKSFIYFIKEDGNWSYYGMLPLEVIQLIEKDKKRELVGQELSISRPKVGSIIHELGHALGLIHEHSRWDKLDHMIIDSANIDQIYFDDNGKLLEDIYNNGFATLEMGEHSILFDFGSIMMYPPTSYAKPGTEVFKKKNGDSYKKEYQREHLSEADKEVINRMYPKKTVSPDIIISKENSKLLSDGVYRAAGEVIYAGDPGIIERGFYYGKLNGPITKVTAPGTAEGSYFCDLWDLEPKTVYYVKAYVMQHFEDFLIEWVSDNEIVFTTDDLPDAVHEIIPPDILEKFYDLGIEIIGGNNPPDVEGTFNVSPCILVKSNFPDGLIPGHQFADMYLTFSQQDNVNQTVVCDFIQGSSSANGLGSFITGNGNKFSVFSEMSGTNNYGEYKSVYIYSGEIVEGGIIDHYRAFIMTMENSGTIARGNGRLIKDGDGFSERIYAKHIQSIEGAFSEELK